MIPPTPLSFFQMTDPSSSRPPLPPSLVIVIDDDDENGNPIPQPPSSPVHDGPLPPSMGSGGLERMGDRVVSVEEKVTSLSFSPLPHTHTHSTLLLPMT